MIEPKHLDGTAALIATNHTAMGVMRGERHTAFVKRIVCAYLNALPEASALHQTILSALRHRADCAEGE